MSNQRRYLLGTGYHPRQKPGYPDPVEFAAKWQQTVSYHAFPYPVEILVVGQDIPKYSIHFQCPISKIELQGDLGHIRDKHEGKINHYLTGWAAGMLAAAMVAYNNVLDFVYQEQDCLAFGPYIEQLYTDMGDGDMTIGPPLNPPHQKLTSAQSLFLVHHRFIPTFVKEYLNCGPDACQNGQFGEQKFSRLEELFPAVRRSGNWILDRNRPFTWDAKVWSAQQWTLDEFNTAKQKGFI